MSPRRAIVVIHVTVVLASITGAAAAGLYAAHRVTLPGDSRGYAIVSATCFGFSGAHWLLAHIAGPLIDRLDRTDRTTRPDRPPRMESLMFPIGSTVTVASVEHLGRAKRPTKLIGRTGTVMEHTEDGMNVLSGLGKLERVTGYWAFGDEHLAAG